MLKDKIFRRLKALIPQKISNKTVLAVLRMLSKLYAVPEAVIQSNASHNKEMILRKKVFEPDNYIENQYEWKEIKFGKKYSMSYSGCEIIAVYNALCALGNDMVQYSIENLISIFEHDGAVLGGFFGVSPYAVAEYFRKKGYDVTVSLSMDEALINAVGKKSDTVIVTAYNDKYDITRQIHTVNITKEKRGTYAVHNAYHFVHGSYAAKDGYDTLHKAINAISDSGPAGICVIGIAFYNSPA